MLLFEIETGSESDGFHAATPLVNALALQLGKEVVAKCWGFAVESQVSSLASDVLDKLGVLGGETI